MNEDIKDQLALFLKSYGWEFSKEKEFLIRFLGESSNTEFHLIIDSDPSWISLTIWPYLPPFPKEKLLDGFILLGTHNFQMKLARLGMTDDCVVTLCVDIPLQGFNEKTFHLALDVISYYADTMYSDFIMLWEKD